MKFINILCFFIIGYSNILFAQNITTTIKPEEEKNKKPWSAGMGLTHTVGSGTFVSDENIRETADSFVQTWGINGSYKFDFLKKKLTAGSSFTFDLELTTPTSNPARRITPYDMYFFLSAPSIYKENITGIDLSFSGRFYIPTSYSSLYVTKKFAALQGNINISRTFKPASFLYSFRVRKNFNTYKVPLVNKSVVRSTDIITSNNADVFQINSGYANTSFTLYNLFQVNYTIIKDLSLSYSLFIINSFKYDIVSSRDEFSADNADIGRGRSDALSPTFELAFGISEFFKEDIKLPVNISLALGITSFHPAQSADNKNIIWPIFFNSFGSNRAANNYGSVYFSVSGVY